MSSPLATGIEIAFALGAGLVRSIAEAMERGDPDAVAELTKHLQSPDEIKARARALVYAQNRKAELELGGAR